MTAEALHRRGKFVPAIVPLLLLILTSISPAVLFEINEPTLLSENQQISNVDGDSVWDPLTQPWGQYGRTPTRNGTMPMHGADGGPGIGSVEDVTVYGTIDHPVVNWVGLDDSDGSDAYGSIIGDFSNSISRPDAAIERCGKGQLFPVTVHNDGVESYLSILTGDDAKVAWQVNLGQSNEIRSTPILHDIDGDEKPEILVVYDTASSLQVDAWSPELTCTESGWQKNGHSNERLWSYSDTNYRIGITSPHAPTSQSNHDSITQPLLADLQLDGSPELVLAVVDENSNDPTVISFTLTTSVPSEPDWQISLDRGTHPSDPSWAALDSSTTAVVLTTIDSNSGNMWIWRIDGASGSLDWERVAVQGTDSDSDSPRLRLPGPVIVQLDQDDAPEMIITVPTDSNGRTSGNGARFIGMELTSTTEVFNFRAPNGYSDTQPLPIDTTGDGEHDRLCWATWYSESTLTFNRKGMVGCHDISLETPLKDWSRDLQRGNGNDNDEIAVSSPFWMDIDGNDEPEVLIAFGQRLWAFDGETGASADINNAWSSPLSMPHRVWASAAVADVDGDGTLDILIGDTLVSQQVADMAPLADQRGISFNPTEPDPGQQVTITGQFSNIGTMDNDENVDAVLLLNGNEIARERFADVEPIAPSGEGGPLTFSTVITAELGIHNITMILDVNSNLTEAREDNNIASTELVVVEPFVAQVELPVETPRISPGTSQQISIQLLSTGSRTADWTLTWDDSAMPDDWSFSAPQGTDLNPTLSPNAPVTIVFDASVPGDALGDENTYVDLILTLDQDTSVNSTVRMPLEVLRTRGLSVTGPSGLMVSDGFGRVGHTASAWMVIENLGNAQETTTSIEWTAPAWGGTPSLHRDDGSEVFSLTLSPNENVELFAHLTVPLSTSIGSSTSTILTMCIGSGESTLCEELEISFTAVSVTVSPIHTRSLPNASLTWTVEADLPTSGELKWNMAAANMIHNGWSWTTAGSLSLNGTGIELTGDGDSFATGSITLALPVDAVPHRHVFSSNDDIVSNADLNFSLQVLQIYRAKATLLEPLPPANDQAFSMNVSETESVLLRLENPGNGQDDFLLTTDVKEVSQGIPAPNVTFEILYSDQRSLGPLASTIATVEVTLAEDVPAQEPFILSFIWTSLGDASVFDVVDVLVEAEPDHRWGLNISSELDTLVVPDERVTINMTATNIGNADDTLTIVPVFTVEHYGDDSSEWTAASLSSEQELNVNQSESLSLNFTVPRLAWHQSSAELELRMYSEEIYVSSTNITFTVDHVSGWRFNLANTSLTIDPSGQNLTLTVQQLGNAPSAPYYAKAGAGWNLTLSDGGETVQPQQTTTMNVFVMPPEDAIAGEIGLLQLRISDTDGAGSVVQQIPVRIGEAPNISIAHKGVWKINSAGGLPTAWIENNGNDVAVLELELTGLPEGWTVEGHDQLVIAPNQIKGIPLNPVPTSEWSGQRFLATLEVVHPTLGMMSYDIEIERGIYAFLTTPVHQATVGSEVITIMNSEVNDGDLTSSETITMSDNMLTLQVSNGANEVILTSSEEPQDSLSIYVYGYELPEVSVNCDLQTSSFSDLGRIKVTGQVGQCDLVSTTQPVRATMILLTDTGEKVEVLQDSILLAANSNASYPANISEWMPSAGAIEITLFVIDSYGRILGEDTINTVARSNGWNIGIFSFTSSDGDLKISFERTEYQRLDASVCRLTIESLDSSWSTERIVDLVNSDFAPVVQIQNVEGIADNERLEATIQCDSPYDLDDNDEDNSAIVYFSAPDESIVEQSDVVLIILIASSMLALGYVSGILKPPQQQENTKRKKSPALKKAPPVEEQSAEHEEDDEFDDLSFEFEEEVQPTPIESIEQVIHIEEEVLDIEDEPEDVTASGRLASLRSEMNDGDNSAESMDERMKRLFGEK